MWSFEVLAIITSMFSHWKKRIASKIVKKYVFSLEKFWYIYGISIFQRKYHTPKNFQCLEL